MKIILVTASVLALAFACGGKQKVQVNDSEHTINIGADLCEIFDDKAEKQDCVRRLLVALDQQGKDCEAQGDDDNL